jgi:hypothetical protein
LGQPPDQRQVALAADGPASYLATVIIPAGSPAEERP